MLDPSEIYAVDPAVAAEVEARTAGGSGPVLVHAVRGFVDAGGAGRLSAEHLTEQLPTERLATFDVDQLLDYRSRRPTATFEGDHWGEYDEPELAVDLVRDTSGVPFLLLHGVEPDVQWERFAAAVRQIVERFDVPLTVGLHGIPMGIPHTRPLSVTAHANRPELVADYTSWFGTVQVPASAGTLLEIRLGQSGHDAMGFAVHVPHYLAQVEYPTAALALLEAVGLRLGLEFDLEELRARQPESITEIEQQIAEQDGEGVLHGLEEQYDIFSRGAAESLLADDASLPTGDELASQLEQFLARQRKDDQG